MDNRRHWVAHMPSRAKHRTAVASAVVAGVAISHAQKLYYSADGITKLELAEYYEQVAEWMLPHVKNRLLCLRWCPDGIGGRCSFERHPPKSTPNHFRAFQVVAPSSTKEFLALYDVQALVALVQGGVLEIHVR